MARLHILTKAHVAMRTFAYVDAQDNLNRHGSPTSGIATSRSV